jgi:excisionase family DNA binding protein
LSTNFSGDQPDFSDWISQAEAAQVRGVSRQAISKLIRAGRLKTFEVGGHVLVSRSEILSFRPQTAGRPKSSKEMKELDRILKALASCSPETRQEVFQRLKAEFPIHPLESKLGAPAEVILEAIDRAGPLTLRGIRGVLAESAFEISVVKRLMEWESLPTPSDPPYDYLLDDGHGAIKVQVKLQRKRAGRPMMANEGYRRLSSQMFVVETQRTRGGKDLKTGEDTRPYRFGEFDILVVATEPSTQRWDTFLYTVSRRLIPIPDYPHLLLKFQPVPGAPNEDWTDSFERCVGWFRSGLNKTIGGVLIPDPE